MQTGRIDSKPGKMAPGGTGSRLRIALLSSGLMVAGILGCKPEQAPAGQQERTPAAEVKKEEKPKSPQFIEFKDAAEARVFIERHLREYQPGRMKQMKEVLQPEPDQEHIRKAMVFVDLEKAARKIVAGPSERDSFYSFELGWCSGCKPESNDYQGSHAGDAMMEVEQVLIVASYIKRYGENIMVKAKVLENVHAIPLLQAANALHAHGEALVQKAVRMGLLSATINRKPGFRVTTMVLIPATISGGVPFVEEAVALLKQYGEAILRKTMRYARKREAMVGEDGVTETLRTVYYLEDLKRYCKVLTERGGEAAIRKARAMGYTDVEDVYWAAFAMQEFGERAFRAEREIWRGGVGGAKRLYRRLGERSGAEEVE